MKPKFNVGDIYHVIDYTVPLSIVQRRVTGVTLQIEESNVLQYRSSYISYECDNASNLYESIHMFSTNKDAETWILLRLRKYVPLHALINK
jgi:hypothetical protein